MNVRTDSYGFVCEHCPAVVRLTMGEFDRRRGVVVCDHCEVRLRGVSERRKVAMFARDRRRRIAA